MPVTLGWDRGEESYEITFNLKEVYRAIKTKNFRIPLPKRDGEKAVSLGSQGPDLQLKFTIHSIADFNTLQTLVGGIYIYVWDSTIAEIPNDSLWWLDEIKMSRKGAYVERWDVDLKLFFKWE